MQHSTTQHRTPTDNIVILFESDSTDELRGISFCKQSKAARQLQEAGAWASQWGACEDA
jgi:sorbitol-specific phosphotransferase system component IIA